MILETVPGTNDHEAPTDTADEATECRVVLHTLTGVSLVRVIGDVDLAAANRLRETFESALAAAPWVIVDLSRAGAIDSVGIGILLAACHAARRRSGDLLLAAAPPFFVSVLDATRLTSVFAMFDTVPKAMTAVHHP